MNIALSLIGWIADSMAYMTELIVYGLHAVWITIVQATIAFLDALDDLFPDLDLAHNALWRALIMAGMWFIPCAFVLAILACAFVGLVADPEGDWSLGSPPNFGRGGSSPQKPLNL